MMIALALLSALSGATSLSGVEIYSRTQVRFGRWDIRMKAAATPGSVSSFFTYYPDSYRGSPIPWREIDIEVLGKNGSAFQSNLITGEASSQVTSEKVHTFDEDLSKTYHTYTLDWTPDSVVWRLDGNTVRKTTTTTARYGQQVLDLRDSTQTYRMNLWASSSADWVGALDVNALPILQIVHWMRYSSYTPGAGPNGSNFTQAWIDSFKVMNTARWAFGDWTFDKNLATFTSNNAKVQDGHLIMMLSTDDKVGQFPATFPHDTLKPTSLRPEAHAAGKGIVRMGRSSWFVPGADWAEAVDARGARAGKVQPVADGLRIDLPAAAGLVVVRTRDASWKLVAR